MEGSILLKISFLRDFLFDLVLSPKKEFQQGVDPSMADGTFFHPAKAIPSSPLDPDHLARGGHRGLPGVLQGVLEEGIVPGEGGFLSKGTEGEILSGSPEMADIFP